jgi:hypothetical protein
LLNKVKSHRNFPIKQGDIKNYKRSFGHMKIIHTMKEVLNTEFEI